LALAILQQAETLLRGREMRGGMWFNMACFATRVGRLPDAMRYLNRAIDGGYTKAEKYRDDPDLAPLRWRADFKQLVRSLT
jgi:hypothetical protein